jgi:hypothetical protein
MLFAVALKSQLLLRVPGIKVYQDVDDGRESGTMDACVFVCLATPKYFQSKAIHGQISKMLEIGAPIVLLDARIHDGYVKFADKSSICDACPAELSEVFKDREIHTPDWSYEGREFMLKRLADEVLAACGEERRLTVPALWSLARPITLYASPNNPGAAAFVEEMRAGLYPSSPPLTLTTEGGTFPFMHLYLNKDTFVGEAGAALAEEVATRIKEKNPPLLVHEIASSTEKGGVDFAHFFTSGVTPPDLLAKGILSRIAVSIKGGGERSTCIRLALQALGPPPLAAKKKKCVVQ